MLKIGIVVGCGLLTILGMIVTISDVTCENNNVIISENWSFLPFFCLKLRFCRFNLVGNWNSGWGIDFQSLWVFSLPLVTSKVIIMTSLCLEMGHFSHFFQDFGDSVH